MLLILLAVAVVVAVRIARRTMRTNRGGGYALFGEHELSAAEHRATAEQSAAAGQLGGGDPSSTQSRRAPAGGDRACSIPFPGEPPPNSPAMPDARCPISPPNCSAAADAFNDVTYGERPGTEPAYRMIADLDDHLRRHTAARPPATLGARAPADGWAEVR